MTKITNLDQAQTIIDSYLSKPPKGNYRLVRIKKLMHFLGDPQEKIKTIHIAGTSGKTSTSYYVAALLHSAGYKTGLTVSPHVNKISERAQIDFFPLDDGEYCDLLGKFLDIIKPTGIKPSKFELLIAFAYWVFEKKSVDYAVVEVGLGGLLDGTNVIKNPQKICVITDIGIDHTKLLGNTISEIAAQKAGIIQKNNSVFMYRQSPQVMKQVKNACLNNKADLILANNHYASQQILSGMPHFQKRNLNLAVEAVNYAIARDFNKKLSINDIENAKLITIPGRMEVKTYQGKTIILDGSHNVQKISNLVKSVEQNYGDRQIALMVSFGNSEKQNIQNKFNLLKMVSDKIILTKFDEGQDEIRLSIPPDKLKKYAQKSGFNNIITEPDYEKAFQLLNDLLDKNKIGLITGSFYLAAVISRLIDKGE